MIQQDCDPHTLTALVRRFFTLHMKDPLTELAKFVTVSRKYS